MITYLYTLDYDDNSADGDSGINDEISEETGELSQESSNSTLFASLSLNTRVYAVAEKYGIQGLKDVAQLKFSTQLKRTCVEKELLSIIDEVYTSTPPKDRGLRDPLLEVIYGDIQYWTTQEDFLNDVNRCNDFYADILRYTVSNDLQKLEAAISTVSDPGYCSLCKDALLLRKWRSRKNYINFEKYCGKCGIDTVLSV